MKKIAQINNVKNQKGFSFIELILVMAIFAVLASASVPISTTLFNRSFTQSTAQSALSQINKTKEFAMYQRDNQTWGICLNSGSIRTYSGSCGSPSYSEDVEVPNNVQVNGLNDTTFNSRGEPSSTLNVTVSGADYSITINVNEAGGITSAL